MPEKPRPAPAAYVAGSSRNPLPMPDTAAAVAVAVVSPVMTVTIARTLVPVKVAGQLFSVALHQSGEGGHEHRRQDPAGGDERPAAPHPPAGADRTPGTVLAEVDDGQHHVGPVHPRVEAGVGLAAGRVGA